SDVDNTEGFEPEVRLIKQLAFDGKSEINPRQIPLVNTIYAPSEKEIQNAKEVICGIREAEAIGSGVNSVNGKMVDKPIVE
ncbi:citrate lyase subunit beta, partial [Enterococcus faecalis]